MCTAANKNLYFLKQSCNTSLTGPSISIRAIAKRAVSVTSSPKLTISAQRSFTPLIGANSPPFTAAIQTWNHADCLRHIAEGHKGDYSKIGAPSGKSWDTFAKWCIGQTLGSPSSTTYQKSNATYLYQAPVQIWNNGTLQKTYQNRVSVRTSDRVIVTSYISRA